MAEKCAPSRQGALLCKTNFELAQFAYQQVRQIKEQVESPEWQAHIKLMKSRQDILEHIGQSREAGKARHYLNQQERFQRLDAEEAARGAAAGKPREKFVRPADMLGFLDGGGG